MKKDLCLLLAALLILLCTACGNSGTSGEAAPKPVSQAAPEPEPTEEPAPEPAPTEEPTPAPEPEQGSEPLQELGIPFEAPESYDYILYDYYGRSENGLEPALGLKFPYGWGNCSTTSIEDDGKAYAFAYGFKMDNIQLSWDAAEAYGYFINSYNEIMTLYFATRKDAYYGGSENHRFEPRSEYTVETSSGQQITVSQGVLWQTPGLSLWDVKETKTEDGIDWHGYYAESAIVSNNGHEICIWLQDSDMDGMYLKDIFALIF